MIDKIINYILEHKKTFIIIGSCLLVLLIGLIVWKVYFSKLIEFKKEEKLFTQTVERFYSMNKSKLPKNGEIRELTLQDMYNGGHIDDLFMPGTRKMCDPDNSFVRVYNDNGKYKYYTYLECGKFKSKIDHVGPVITLNESEQVVFSLNSEYKEYGVKEVKDNKDGNIDINKVIIDSSKVNMNKLGIYPVTYTVYDSNHNKTVVTRNVVVAKNLTEEVRNNTSDDGYYKGNVKNNYLLFSGMLFRIVNVDESGNIKIVSYDSIANVNYGTSDTTYDNSNVNKWLNNYYYSNIHNTDYLKKDNKWCIDTISDINNIPLECSNYSSDYAVGLLSIYDYKNSEDNGKNTYLFSHVSNLTSNLKSDDSNIVFAYLFTTNFYEVKVSDLVPVKPVLVLRSNLYAVSGDGTMDNPYKLDDYYPANNKDLLNTRLVGEYVNYFGTDFRIAGFDKDGNTKLVSVYPLSNSTTFGVFKAGYENINKFNPSEDGNIGYKLNTDLMDYIDDKYIISHEYSIPLFNSSLKYDEYTKETINTKIVIPTSYEMFTSPVTGTSNQDDYWIIDYVNDNYSYYVNGINGLTFTSSKTGDYKSLTLKIVFYVNKDVKINSGSGTISSPYIIR